MKSLTLITAEESNKAGVQKILTEALAYGASECVMICLVDDDWIIRTSGNTGVSRTLGALEIIKHHILVEHLE